jgi:serine protease Do
MNMDTQEIRTVTSRFRPRAGRLAAGVAALGLLFTAPAVEARQGPEGFADLAEKLLPAVVNVSTTQVIHGRQGPEVPQFPPGSPFEEFFKDFLERNRPKQPRERRATSLGSGFIIDAKAGYVVTNNHVIQDADEIAVILHDDTRVEAKVVGRDPKTDVAVLKIDVANLKLQAVKFGDSDKTRVGDWVVAIGNPFGLGGTVTAGIVSARGRDINSGPYDDFIQTDASINRGNSGGPMFNMVGEVVGINTAIYSPSGGSIGIGFAIPSAVAKPVIDQLVKHGRTRRGWLGVRIQAVTEEIAETLGLKKPTGAMVASVTPGGPAEKAKIIAGDVVLKFDGREVSEMRRLPRIVAETEIGREVEVEVWRGGKTVALRVKVGELEEAETAEKAGEKPEKGGKEDDKGAEKVAQIGLTVAALTPKIRERFSLGEEAKGVVVVEVAEGGSAAEKQIRPGDLIVEVSQEEVASPRDVVNKVKAAAKAGRKTVLLLIESQGGMRFVAVRLGKE